MKLEQHALCAIGHTLQLSSAHDRPPAASVGIAVGVGEGAGVGVIVGIAVGADVGDGVGAKENPALRQPKLETHSSHFDSPWE